MNFIEAVKEMKKGNKVRRPEMSPCIKYSIKEGNDYITIHGLMDGDDDKTTFCIELLEATDWEIIAEERNTLSDRHRDELQNNPKVYDYAQEDVKDTIKTIKDRIQQELFDFNNKPKLTKITETKDIWKIIDEEVGNRLT